MTGRVLAEAPLELASTPVRLMDAAERLIAERGIDQASLRAINSAAGSNVAAAHYHFGSKEALVKAILQRRMDEISADRSARLAALSELERPQLRAVAEALVAPFARRAVMEGDTYVRFLAALYRAADPWWGLVAETFGPQYKLVLPLLERCLPTLPRRIRIFRVRTAANVLFAVLASPEHFWPPPQPSADELVETVIDVFESIVAGDRVPCSAAEEDAEMG